MKKLSKFVLGISLLGGSVFSSTPQVDNQTPLPPRVELFLKGFEKGLSLSLGEGKLLIHQKEVKKCFSVLKDAIYNGTYGIAKISLLKISNLLDYPHWVEAEGIEEILPRSKGKIDKISFVANKNSLIFIFKGIENQKNPHRVGYIIPQLYLSTFYGKNYGVATLKGFVKIPSLDSSYHYTSLESVGYANLSDKRGKVFIDGYFEGGGELKLTLLLENLSSQALEEFQQIIDSASSGKRVNLDRNAALFSVIPKRVVLRVEFGKLSKKLLGGDMETIEELKELSQLNGTMGTLARSLLDIVEGKAQGLKVEIENKNNFNIQQLTAVFLLFSFAKTGKEAEEVIEKYFDIKISTF